VLQVSMSELLESGTKSLVGLPRLHGLASKLLESECDDSENILSDVSLSYSLFLFPGDEITLISCRSSLIFCKLSCSSVWQCSGVELSDEKNASADSIDSIVVGISSTSTSSSEF